jgi:hypothetical protein
MNARMEAKAVFVLLAALVCLLYPAALLSGISLRGGLTHERVVWPGETYRGAVTVVNSGDKEQDVLVYQTDYRFTCDGAYHYDQAGTNERSNASWMDFSPRLFTVPAGGQVDIGYILTVPNDRSLTGTYWSMLMVEATGSDSAAAAAAGADNISLGIHQVVRYGLQMVSHVGNTGLRELDFLDGRLERAGARRLLEVDLENTGERWLRPVVWAELYEENGNFIGRFDGGKRRIYPGTSVRYSLDLTEVPGGEYRAVVIADCDDDHVFGATYRLIFEHEDGFTVR